MPSIRHIHQTHFYPRSPCGERPGKHAQPPTQQDFYPRSPCGERQSTRQVKQTYRGISIHALLAESDSQQPRGTTRTTYFYPRSPCGERPKKNRLPVSRCLFLSTLSLRRATRENCEPVLHQSHFYPRSPCGERHTNLRRHRRNNNFYPRSPCGERPRFLPPFYDFSKISIHALLAESDRVNEDRYGQQY